MKPATKLTRFRKQCERETGRPATRILMPLALVLNDLSRMFRLNRGQRRHVLGRRSTVLLEDIRNERIQLVKRR